MRNWIGFLLSLAYAFGIGHYTVSGPATAEALEHGIAGPKVPRWLADLLTTICIMLWPLAALMRWRRR